jgi:formamidopyrimidine-DNA glycosylase
MPELPEVETVVRALRNGGRGGQSIVGKTIESVDLVWDGVVEIPTVAEFENRIIGQSIVNVSRRAKYIVIHLSTDYLLVHLRMSGDLLVGEGEVYNAKHVRVGFHLDDGTHIAFNNPRKFGRVWLVNDVTEIFSKLGPEPLSDNFSQADFYKLLSSTKRVIKSLLLDQKKIVGIGNIYADESLHRSKIHPQSPANLISRNTSNLLYKNIRSVLKEAIKRNGSSFDWIYQGGEFQNEFAVYQKTDEPCPNCGTPVSRIVVAQRGTHYCPRCQVLLT